MAQANEQAAARKSATAANKKAAKRSPKRAAKKPPAQPGVQPSGEPENIEVLDLDEAAMPGANLPPSQQPQEQKMNAVILERQIDDMGNIKIVPQTFGNVQVLEVQTIIELGLKEFRKMLALDSNDK